MDEWIKVRSITNSQYHLWIPGVSIKELLASIKSLLAGKDTNPAPHIIKV